MSCQLLNRMWGHDRIADRRLWTTRKCIRRVKRGLHRKILSAWGFVEHQMWTHRNNSGMPQNSSVKFFVWFVVERIIGLWSFECCRFCCNYGSLRQDVCRIACFTCFCRSLAGRSCDRKSRHGAPCLHCIGVAILIAPKSMCPKPTWFGSSFIPTM